MHVFRPGKLTIVEDIGAGSSAKGLRAAHIWRHHRPHHTTFAVNTFMENAAHTVIDDDGIEHVYQCLSSVTTLGDFEKQYLAPGCVFAKDTIMREINKYGMTPRTLGIHPNAAIVSTKDVDYEAGRCDFEGNPLAKQDSPNLRIGSTIHGVGASRARRILRRADCVIARDVPELKAFLCDTSAEIMDRLDNGQSGLMEIAQGYQLSLYSRFFPKTTSRNCTVSAALDDAMLPVVAAGPFIANFRTFPIRVNNNKYVRKHDQKILTWEEYRNTDPASVMMITGDSGGCYPDQRELTWAELSESAGKTILEQTSLTKLPRRVFTFSQENLKEGLLVNRTGDATYISINFMNYVDASVEGKRTKEEILTPKVRNWIDENLLNRDLINFYYRHKIDLQGIFIGTYRKIDDSVFCHISEI